MKFYTLKNDPPKLLIKKIIIKWSLVIKEQLINNLTIVSNDTKISLVYLYIVLNPLKGQLFGQSIWKSLSSYDQTRGIYCGLYLK